MSLPLDSKKFPGMQSDTYSYDRNMKPIAQPPCDLPSQHQFEDITEYITVKNDRWNNKVSVDWTSHRDATAGMGQYGDRQYASNSADLQSTGHGKNMGLNVIEHARARRLTKPKRS